MKLIDFAPFEKSKTYIDDINITFTKDGEFSSRLVTVKVYGVEGHVEPGGCITQEEFNDLHHEITEEEARQLIEEVNNGTE